MLEIILPEKWKTISKGLQKLLNLSLVLLGGILVFFLFRELIYLLIDACTGNHNVHDILGKVLVFFLYFAFISMIVTYFSESHHFPLSYLLYIGITASVRYIIVNNGNPSANFWLSIVILLLAFSYILLTPRGKRYKDKRRKMQ
ncbi:phosphate-starvation-inducible protein PsiE [Fictibacillus terranigra]|uniref:Protein PsiE n=1 Tax=Fictibacillus terranigra TaxID=3058424 RepID=A0ABT8E3H9_9BACL|nr:phosphate-starvation-inducible PsiE family protein [Fictibacillus sp. CENA-BCM004]MDN4072469.1 phosphate-starvation-inducible PsiE family protein [Fictibacillus sp. CENA-BCM004]